MLRAEEHFTEEALAICPFLGKTLVQEHFFSG
jgi:hypothetical protein